MMCARCETLEERVAWLESELGLQITASQHEALRRHFLTRQARRPQASRFVMALYGFKGRAATRLQLLEATARDDAEDDRTPKIIDVWACVTRKVLGADAIETVWGSGYRLTSDGLARVAAIIGEQSAPSTPTASTP